MSFWKKLFGGSNPVADTVVETAKGVADIVERWAPSDAAKHAMQQDVQKLMNENVAAARAAAKPGEATNAFAQVLHSISEFTNHMMAPALSVFICCVLFGAIRVSTDSTDPLILTWGEAVGAYWLGARALARDIPTFIKMIVELRRAGK